MHRLKYALVAFVCAIALDLLLGMVRPSEWLPLKVCAAIGGAGMTACLFVIPLLFVLVPFRRSDDRNWIARTLWASVTSWYGTLQFRMHFDLPATREIARQNGDISYDGVGLNAAILTFGWFPPLLVTLSLILIFSIVRPWLNKLSGISDSDDPSAPAEPSETSAGQELELD